MDNLEKLATLGTQTHDEENNLEKLTTLGTQDTRRRQQSRDTDNIGYTRHTTKTTI